MRTIVVANQKGGSGKTTTAVNLAAALAEMGERVLLFDTDPQRSASRWLDFSDENGGSPNIIDALKRQAPIEAVVHSTSVPNLDLLPACIGLLSLEAELARETVPAFVLDKRVKELPKNWDYVIIDTPPELRLITQSVLIAFNELLIVAQLSNQDIEGMSDLLKMVDNITDGINENLKITAVVPCRVNMRTKDANEVLSILMAKFPDTLTGVKIRDTVKLREAQAYRMPITVYDTSGNGAADYRALARHIASMSKSNNTESSEVA